MAHESQREFIKAVFDGFPAMKSNVRVLDIGSMDVNGNNREYFSDPFEYVGVDVAPGPNVDVVCLGHEYKGGPFDVVMSAECLEHDPHHFETVINMCTLTRPGGLMVITCATAGRLEHGTARTTPEDNPGAGNIWPDYYYNIELGDIADCINQELFERIGINIFGTDLYFFGVKKQEG